MEKYISKSALVAEINKRIIVAQLEERANIVVRVDSSLCTDEIVAWAYIDDLI